VKRRSSERVAAEVLTLCVLLCLNDLNPLLS